MCEGFKDSSGFFGVLVREFKVSVGVFRLHHKKVFVVSGLGFRVWGFNLRALDFVVPGG